MSAGMTESLFDNHKFRPRGSSDSRSPCPALNALANHDYIPHNGRDITFITLIQAMVLVYNISYPLAFLLTLVAFLTYGKLSSHSYQWTVDLDSLSQRGSWMVAHDGALVHPDGRPSTSPDPTRVKNIIHQASTACDSEGRLKGGLDLFEIVRIRTQKVDSHAHPKLNGYHEQISLGECSLLWEVFRNPGGLVIPTCSLEQLLGQEHLPDGWWNIRPKKAVGLLQARKTANEIDILSKKYEKEAGI